MSSDYKISEKDMEEICERFRDIPDEEWFRLIFCELHEIKSLMKRRLK